MKHRVSTRFLLADYSPVKSEGIADAGEVEDVLTHLRFHYLPAVFTIDSLLRGFQVLFNICKGQSLGVSFCGANLDAAVSYGAEDCTVYSGVRLLN